MAVDYSALQASVAKLTADITTLIGIANQLLANQPDPTAQATVDAITASVAAADTSVVGAIAADSPTGATGPAPAPTGATGS